MKDHRDQHHIVAFAEVIPKVVAGPGGNSVPHPEARDHLLGDGHGGWEVEDDSPQAGILLHQKDGIDAGAAADIEQLTPSLEVEILHKYMTDTHGIIVHGH